MTEQEAQATVEDLLRRDPAIAEAVAALRSEGVSWIEIARRAARAAERIVREVP